MPTLALALLHPSDAEQRAYVLADNELALNARWDREILAICACPVGYPSLDLFLILSGMMSLAAPAFLPIRLRAPDNEAA